MLARTPIQPRHLNAEVLREARLQGGASALIRAPASLLPRFGQLPERRRDSARGVAAAAGPGASVADVGSPGFAPAAAPSYRPPRASTARAQGVGARDAGTREVWQFLSPWSDMYDLDDDGSSFLRAVGTQLGTAKFNVQRFAGAPSATPPPVLPPPSRPRPPPSPRLGCE